MSEKFEQFSKAEDGGFVDFVKKEPAPKRQQQKRCSCSDLVVIVNYIKAEQQKKASSLKIGIFTVFLVVTIITMLESVISIAPILFVNIGQQNAGAVDFKLTYTASDLITGNNNFYTRDPFAKGNTSYQPLTASALLNRRKNLNQNIPQIYQNPDSIKVGNSYGLLNFTWYNNQLKGLSMFDGFAPRTLWPTIALGTNTTNTTNLVLVIDCAQEQKIGLAPYFNPYILGAYQVMLSQGTMDYLNISIGDQVNFYFDTQTSPVNLTSKPFELPFKKTFAAIAAAAGIDTRPLTNILQQSQSELYINFTVVQSYLDSNGKFPAAYGNVAIFDCNYVLDYVFQLSEVEINVQFANEPLRRKAALNLLSEIEANATSQNLSFCHFGYEIDGVLNNQASYYMGKYDVIQKNIEGIAAIMQRTMTLQANTTIHTPLMTQFKSTNLMQSFLQSTLITIICFLIILSGQLLYSLMLSEVDSKTYEYGMLRALGFKSSHLVGMITIQSLVFSIPGVALGLTVAYILNLFFRLVIFQLAQNSASYGLTTTSLYLGIGFGLIMPLLSILFPIKQALGKNLRQSLDLNHRSQDQTLVEVTKLEDLGMSVTQTIAGLLLVSMGFMTYYLAPLTFFLDEMVWFLFIFDVILISIVIGLTLLSIMLFEHVEKGLLTFLIATCARRDKRLKTLINKNLDSHRARNSKTSILFTLSLSFVIFSSANFKLLTGLISSEVLSLFGSDLYISSPNGNNGDYLDQNGLQIFLTTQKSFDYSINDWSFVSVSLGDFMNAIARNTSQSIKQSGKSGYAPLGSALYAVPSNYLEVIDIDYYYPSSVQPNIQTNKTVNKRPNAVDLLYSSVGQFDYNTTTTDYYNITTSLSSANLSQQYNYTTEVNILLPQGIKSVFSTEVGTDATIFSFGTKNWKYLTRVRAYITKFPGLMFSGIKQLAVGSLSGVVSEPQWQQMMNDFVTQNPLHYESWYNLTQTGQNYTYDIPKYKLLISLNQNITSERKEYIMNGLRQYMTRTQYIVDVNSIIDSLGGVTQIFNLLIVVIGMISLIIVFFVLLIATTANIKENIWEYGVLRSVGLTKAEGQRIYMYEAFLVISAASILGVSIGIIVTALVTQQFYTFVELPFKLSLPYYIILILLVTALLTTYFAVLIPIRQVNKYNIAKVLKSGS